MASTYRKIAVLVEGHTEEEFAKQLLCEHLKSTCANVGLHIVNLGGHGHSFGRIETALKPLLNARVPYAAVTTMFDDYAFPNFGGYVAKVPLSKGATASTTPEDRASKMELAVRKELETTLGRALGAFEPFLLVHEFETLLFSNPQDFTVVDQRASLVNAIAAVRTSFARPELINHDQPPAARLKTIFEANDHKYDKRAYGVLVAKKSTLPVIRTACKRFGKWVEWLEAGATGAATWR
jgi:hypothetical protein